MKLDFMLTASALGGVRLGAASCRGWTDQRWIAVAGGRQIRPSAAGMFGDLLSVLRLFWLFERQSIFQRRSRLQHKAQQALLRRCRQHVAAPASIRALECGSARICAAPAFAFHNISLPSEMLRAQSSASSRMVYRYTGIQNEVLACWFDGTRLKGRSKSGRRGESRFQRTRFPCSHSFFPFPGPRWLRGVCGPSPTSSSLQQSRIAHLGQKR